MTGTQVHGVPAEILARNTEVMEQIVALLGAGATRVGAAVGEARSSSAYARAVDAYRSLMEEGGLRGPQVGSRSC